MALLAVNHLTWRRFLQQGLQPQGITLKQLYVLHELERHHSLYPMHIAEILFCDRPTASVIIKNMEKQGWIKREKDTKDSRRFLISLTDAGKMKAEETGLNELTNGVDPLGCFSKEEIKQLQNLLERMRDHLEVVTARKEGE